MGTGGFFGQMWVWPQVPLRWPSPCSPPPPAPPPRRQPRPTPPASLQIKTLRAKGTLISEPRFSTPCETRFFPRENQQTRVYPYPLVAGSARSNPKMGAPDPEKPLFIGFSVLRGSETMVRDHGLRPWSRKGPDHGVGVDLETVRERENGLFKERPSTERPSSLSRVGKIASRRGQRIGAH